MLVLTQQTAATIETALFGEDSLVQVHSDGLRHIRADKRVHEWKPPAVRVALMNVFP